MIRRCDGGVGSWVAVGTTFTGFPTHGHAGLPQRKATRQDQSDMNRLVLIETCLHKAMTNYQLINNNSTLPKPSVLQASTYVVAYNMNPHYKDVFPLPFTPTPLPKPNHQKLQSNLGLVHHPLSNSVVKLLLTFLQTQNFTALWVMSLCHTVLTSFVNWSKCKFLVVGKALPLLSFIVHIAALQSNISFFRTRHAIRCIIHAKHDTCCKDRNDVSMRGCEKICVPTKAHKQTYHHTHIRLGNRLHGCHCHSSGCTAGHHDHNCGYRGNRTRRTDRKS